MQGGISNKDLGARVAALLAREEQVLAAWMFGSRARNHARTSSDLDVALLLAPGSVPGLKQRLAEALAQAAGLDVDVVDIKKTTPVLGYEIVTGGRRVFTRDGALADAAEATCLRTYLDTEHMRRVQHHYLYGDRL